MIKAVALDDEPLSLSIITRFCAEIDHIDLKKTFTEQQKAIRYINKFEIDLIFLDIQMPSKNGIEFYKNLSREIKVIFITAFEQYAVEGFNLNATDYLLKPFSFERFKESVDRAQKELELERKSAEEKTHLEIRADYKLHLIEYQDIRYIEALDDYIQIHRANNKRLVARGTMRGMLKKLPDNLFVRIHRSYIVPLNRIKSIGGDQIELDEQSLPIGASYKAKLLEKFENPDN